MGKTMADTKPRKMIAIEPGSREWKAWLSHNRGTRNELRMLSCAKRGEAFRVWSPFPPTDAAPDASRLSAAKVQSDKPRKVDGGRARSVDEIADRLEQRDRRSEVERTIDARHRKGARKRDKSIEEALGKVLDGGSPLLSALPESFGVTRAIDPDELKHNMIERQRPPAPRVKITVLRDDPVGQMHRRGHLGDDVDQAELRLTAARTLQSLYEQAEIGAARGIDPTRDKVDGGSAAEPDTDARLAAARQIERVERKLGEDGADLARMVLWHKFTIAQAAAAEGLSSARELNYIGSRFRECLDTSARALGLVAEAKIKRMPPDKHVAMARLADKPELHRAAGLARRKW
jgi:hypothetical protein